ncbi:biotin/lipoyl-containing protein [Micromonospora sp. MH99]|uniref:acetyl-CoA carboxylase biotin carboxyl carrier protein n=1 Tax=Micromonospora sp. MH99 TaxID=1945510 RepID=UPI001F33FE15|nr:biotin/lipoyl-containing protein [Micromonospora sp. MH99]MCF0095164.1 Biotin carboxyl carrier protein of acetyl-CoA carboxylase [Micromonospora sp. MH99]
MTAAPTVSTVDSSNGRPDAEVRTDEGRVDVDGGRVAQTGPEPADTVLPAGRQPADGQPGADADVEEVLAVLRRQARHLLAELPGPVRRIRLRSGTTVLDVQWHPDEPAARPDVPPAPPPAGFPPSGGARVPGPPAALIRPPVPGRPAVRAPIVGTFYRAPEPGARPFVAVGDLVRPGQPVAIVEAMKLMNEVTADRAGRVAAILVEDGQPVEYDQPLVELDPA